ncbi:MAG TPA: transketolase [Propionibacteriaceae bacterium]|nr:transketolase [Micropruina sp.]HBX80192.1 transketolase [Propionibacteriaceae bacterium]HBY21859.1 transketolase [Propionibacteriaceae bacterium]
MAQALSWSELDEKAVNTARVLAADAVEKVGNGHPGTAISLAPVAYLLYQKVMTGDPADPHWVGRDRFVLSAGHSSLTQYTELFLAGYGLEIGDIEALRTEGALTPGHPEFGHTRGVECTTGPLGAGVAIAVGFAMAARKERNLLDPTAAPGTSPFDRFVYCVAGDGCMQEGVASEASSLAATQDLGNLFLIYDDNRITIEGDTKIAFSEDVQARYESYGWDTYHVDFTNGFTTYEEKVGELYDVIEKAKTVTDRPHFIKVTTVIGWPLPNLAGSHSVHGAKLGGAEIAALKTELGLDPAKNFDVDPAVLAYARGNAADRAAAAKAVWTPKYEAWRAANPEKAALFDRLVARALPEGFEAALPVFPAGKMATRSASGAVLTALADAVPELWGGSADLAGSNLTTMKGQPSFLPPERQSHDWQGNEDGRTLHFGIREHAMGNIVNGITMSGLTRPYGGTFFVFADYMRPPVRLAALSKIPATYVWTHDSIGVGEDGPTHQPVEHLWAYRAIPGFDVVRPADANETAQCWAQILRNVDRPAGIVLSRQDLVTVERGAGACAPAEKAVKGGYVLKEASATPKVVLIGTGSEVGPCLDAQALLEAEGIPTRVVSMPCVEWFDAQSAEYRVGVLPKEAVKVAVEAGIAQGWYKYVGDTGVVVSLEHFGESAAAGLLFAKYGFTGENVAAKAKAAL